METRFSRFTTLLARDPWSLQTWQHSDRDAVLCTFTERPGHGGIARVSYLLSHVLRDLCGSQYRSIVISPQGAVRVSNMDKLLFAGRVVREQVTGNVGWLLFDHLGLARVQHLVPIQFRRPYAVFLHSLEVWQRLSSKRREVLNSARVRLANSHYTVSRIAQANPDVGPIEVCHLSLPPDQFRPDEGRVDRDLLNAIRPNSVLIVGRILNGERYKGHDRLIEAWPQVTARVADAQLVIVGDGNRRAQLQAEVHRSEISPNVLITGHVNEDTLHALYSRAAVFAMPSSGEGFGLVFLEAMQHGLPCIGSTCDASREIVVDGETGFLVDPVDVGGLAESIAALLENPALRSTMGHAGVRRVQMTFSFDRFKACVTNALKPLLEQYERV